MKHTSLPNQHYRGTIRDRIALAKQSATGILTIALLLSFVAGPGRLIQWWLARKKLKGETIWLDTLTFGKRDTDLHVSPPAKAADLAPNTSVPTRVSRAMKHDTYPPPDYPFAYRQPPVSGNVVNGLDETQYRRARKVFHIADYTTPWGGLEFYFHLSYPLRSNLRVFLLRFWEIRHKDGPVNPLKQPVDDPTAMSAIIKTTAHDVGAALVGITELRDHHVYEGYDVPYRYAISLALPMDRETMLTTPSKSAGHEIITIYSEVGQVAIRLAQRIRAFGHEARAVSSIDAASAEILHVPIAISAGLGQLGKHGSMITKKYGSNVRLATVLTNLPLLPDTPEDIGVDDFCRSCQICVTNCPPHAIFDSKQMVRGQERWYVNFDRCVPYFSDNGGCGICIEVCPWSVEGRGPTISEKMLANRASTQSPTS
ncbi:4Fe-4S dicluster domain-containing protein [Candidatus Gracilibacteria bacterium]|nr:4Fe-4S dicluster domain-containing protein [Candidatus Gracilibacteria bacterium]